MDSLNKEKDFYFKQGYFHFKKPSLKLQDICQRAAISIDRLFINTDSEQKTWRSSDGRAKHLINPHLKSKIFLEIIKSPEIKEAISKFLEDQQLQNIYYGINVITRSIYIKTNTFLFFNPKLF